MQFYTAETDTSLFSYVIPCPYRTWKIMTFHQILFLFTLSNVCLFTTDFISVMSCFTEVCYWLINFNLLAKIALPSTDRSNVSFKILQHTSKIIYWCLERKKKTNSIIRCNKVNKKCIDAWYVKYFNKCRLFRLSRGNDLFHFLFYLFLCSF